MPYLDYNRLTQCTDVQLRQFLLTVCHTDTKRRCQAAFPEFFSDTPCQKDIKWQYLLDRYQAVTQVEFHDSDTDVDETFNWFGLKIEVFEFREDGIPQDGSLLLPPDFILQRDDDYDGMTSHDRYLVKIPKITPKGFTTDKEYLVLDVTMTRESNLKYFLWAVPTFNINFD